MVLKNDYRTGIDNLKKSLSIDSTALAGFYLTYAYMYSNQIDSCSAVLKKIYPLKRNVPLKYQLWMDMWYACYFGNSIQDIARDCDLLAESGINTRLLWFDLGVTYHEFPRQFEKSAKAFEKVMEINKDRGSEWKFPLFYEHYGDDLHNLGRHEEEIAIYDNGLAIFPDDRSILRRKAACLISHGDTVRGNECISLIRKSIDKSGLPEAVMESNLGSIYTWAGLPERGESHARKAFNLAPRNFLYTYNLASVLIVENVDVDEGIHFVSTILDSLSRENNRDLYNALLVLKGIGKFKQGSYNDAVENLENGFKEILLPELQHYLPEARQALIKEKSTSAQDPEPSTQHR